MGQDAQLQLSVVTIGALCVQLQAPVAAVRRALRAIDAKPVLTIDHLEHFDEEAVVEPCRQWLNEHVRRRDTA
jgi:hypothetical protein